MAWHWFGCDDRPRLPPLRLCERHAMLFICLAANGECTLPELSEVGWPEADRMPDQWAKSLRMTIADIRRRLRPYGWAIANRRGYGYRLTKLEGRA